MFILLLHHKKPTEEVDRLMQRHRDYLAPYYASGQVVCSGQLKPRTGGILLARFATREQAQELADNDPFTLHGISEYTIIEFEPKFSTPGFEPFTRPD